MATEMIALTPEPREKQAYYVRMSSGTMSVRPSEGQTELSAQRAEAVKQSRKHGFASLEYYDVNGSSHVIAAYENGKMSRFDWKGEG